MSPRTSRFDRAYARLGAAGALFRDGWGDLRVDALRTLAEGRRTPTVPDIDWGAAQRRGRVTIRNGTFASPLPYLTASVASAHVTALLPRDMQAACVFLGAHGESGVNARRWMVGPLVRRGIGALLLHTPFYGLRRPPRQVGKALRTVADQLLLCAAVVEEAAALVAWIRSQGLTPALCGYSMGGALAAQTACRLPFPIVGAFGATGISGGTIFARDLISRQICWDVLGDGARDRLEAVYDIFALKVAPAPVDASRFTLVGCRHDGVVRRQSVEALAELWPAARLEWIDGGHLPGFVRAAPRLRRAVARGLSSRTPAGSDPRRS